MLNKTMAIKLGCSLAALLTACAVSSAAAQPYGQPYGNDYGRTYNDPNRTYNDRSASDPYRNQNTDPRYGSGFDSRDNNRNPRNRNGYEPPRIPGRTFTASDQPGQRLTGTRGDDVFHAGHNAVIMTGGQGADRFVFDVEPWNAGHITDFTPGEDILDLRPLFMTSNYRGNDPLRDGYLQFRPTDSGTQVLFDADGPASTHPWPTTLTTLDNIRPDQIQRTGWLFR